jgi:hypothetical protein
MTIAAVMIDTREPQWVQRLTFGDAPCSVLMLEYGDIQVATDDGHLLVIERKTPEDFLNSLRDDRLFVQMQRMAEVRLDEQAFGRMTTWPYLVITGEFRRSGNGHVITDERGPTGWDYNAVQGALLSFQEMGVFTVFCGGDSDLENCVIRLANRRRDGEYKLLPARPATLLGPGAAFLAGLPGVGVERVTDLMNWAANIPAHALVGITDLEIEAPVPKATRRKIRAMLGLQDKQSLELWLNGSQDETFRVMEYKEKPNV